MSAVSTLTLEDAQKQGGDTARFVTLFRPVIGVVGADLTMIAHPPDADSCRGRLNV